MQFEEILKHQDPTISTTLVSLGTAHLEIDGKMRLNLKKFPGENRFFLYGKIPSFEPFNEPFLCSLLEANLFGQKTGNAYFAYHSPTQSLVLMTTFDEETVTPHIFSKELQRFVNTYSYWQQKERFAPPPPKDKESIITLMGNRNQRLFFI